MNPSSNPNPIPNPAATALVLAAGRGERMRPLTDHTPKPLLPLGDRPLMAWHFRALARAGHQHVVVNTAWLAEQLHDTLGRLWVDPVDSNLKLSITYSEEGRDFGAALETAGGIVRALPLLADVFWVLAGDIYAPDFDFSASHIESLVSSPDRARLWLVPNPPQHPIGDFVLDRGRVLHTADHDPQPRITFSTMGLYRKSFFVPPICDLAPGNPGGVKVALAPMLRRAMDLGWVSGVRYDKTWVDVGTPERLQALRQQHRPPTTPM